MLAAVVAAAASVVRAVVVVAGVVVWRGCRHYIVVRGERRCVARWR